MWKKFIVCALICLSLISFSSFSFATIESTNGSTTAIDPSKYEVLKPEKESYSTTDKVILLNGKAPSGTEITIDIYGTTDIDIAKQTFNLDKLPTEKDYILVVSENVTSGNMGFFQKQMELVKGINKIVINFGVEGVESKEYIVYVYDRIKTENRLNITRDGRLTDILPLLK